MSAEIKLDNITYFLRFFFIQRIFYWINSNWIDSGISKQAAAVGSCVGSKQNLKIKPLLCHVKRQSGVMVRVVSLRSRTSRFKSPHCYRSLLGDLGQAHTHTIPWGCREEKMEKGQLCKPPLVLTVEKSGNI